MDKDMLAFCGLDCTKCDAFIATAGNDDALRAKVAAEWAKAYNVPIQPEDINCTGCRSTGVRVHYCDQLCEIRKCALGKSIDTCAECPDFACDQLNEIFKMAPQAGEALKGLRDR
ncbi:MAG: DUF3795 domain-containing protein [bacterium]|nr:DUF3795 domain-containing protein [bacterium]